MTGRAIDDEQGQWGVLYYDGREYRTLISHLTKEAAAAFVIAWNGFESLYVARIAYHAKLDKQRLARRQGRE